MVNLFSAKCKIFQCQFSDLGRKRCSESEVIIPLLKLLDSENFDVVLQVCRALGNICYDNGEF